MQSFITKQTLTNRAEPKLRYSGIHHFHGFKTEVFVAPNGLVVHASMQYPSSRAEIFIFRQELQTYLLMTRKSSDDRNIDDNEDNSGLNGSWSILYDKGCISIQREIRSFIPMEKQPQRPLYTAD